MLYRIINPSDPHTIEADDHEVAALACFFLGNGAYAFDAVDGSRDKNVPIFLGGGSEAWCRKTFGKSLEAMASDVMKTKRDALIACFESCLPGDEADRARFLKKVEGKSPEEAERMRRAHENTHRSSLNKIAQTAWDVARQLRARAD